MKARKPFNRDIIFYIVMLAFPVLQFCIFYIGVNGRSFLYAFQEIGVGGEVTFSTKTLQYAFKELFSPTLGKAFLTSFLAFLLTYFIGTTLALFFSYFIYKKLPFGSVFKVFLFLPSIISSIVIAPLFLYFVEEAVPAFSNSIFHNAIEGLMSNRDTKFGTIIFYNIFASFGTSVLMYSNAMGNISTEVVEAAKIDGCNQFREFFHVVIPGIFPTITTFAITSVAGIFVNQLSLFAFFSGGEEEIVTLGYYLYKETLGARGIESAYPRLCAFGFILSLIAVPLTILTKYLLERFGPSEK